ncbi:MAG: acyl carrier protein [Acutalibacteraceae bacterium]
MTVLETVRAFFCERCGCEAEDVELAASLDELNIADFEREALAFLLEEAYGVYIPAQELASFETVEDLVGYVEDRL